MAWGQSADEHLQGSWRVPLSWWGETCRHHLLWWRCSLSNVVVVGRLDPPLNNEGRKRLQHVFGLYWSQLERYHHLGGGVAWDNLGLRGVFDEGYWEILHWGWQMSYCQIKFEGRLRYWSQIVSGLPVFSCFWLGRCGLWLVVGLLVSKGLQSQAGQRIQDTC